MTKGETGGSSDLAALSAGAPKGPYRVEYTELGEGPDARPIAFLMGPGDEYLLVDEVPKDFVDGPPSPILAYFSELDAAYRSGRLIEAPTPDLGAQGEPVARGEIAKWRNDALEKAADIAWRYGDPCADDIEREILALRSAEAPAATRPGSGVTDEQIADLIIEEVFGATLSHREDHIQVAAKIRALIQAPRPGETGDGWLPIETAPKDGTRILVEFDRSVGVYAVAWEESVGGIEAWCVDDNKHGPYALRGYMNELRWRPLPAPPSQPHAAHSEDGVRHE